mgnify:FL=1
MVIVVLGILAAIAVPKFVDLSTDATDAAKKASLSAVKSALTISTGQLKRAPNFTELLNNVQGASANGVVGYQVTINGVPTPVAYTFTGSNCTGATATITDTVLCVKDLP